MVNVPSGLPSRIAYFISGHGYGHAVRSARLINALPSTSQVTVYTTIERAFFERELAVEFDYVELELDCGCVQLGALDVDIRATFERYSVIEASRSDLLEASCAYLSEQGAEFVIGDIPPLAFAAAARLGLPSLAISNFTWNEIYAEYCQEYPRFTQLLESIRQDYASADQYARLYPGIDDHPFQRGEEVGMLCRSSARSRKFVEQQLKLDSSRKWCLIYLGEFGIEGIAWDKLKHFAEWQFVGLYPLKDAPANYRQIQLSANVEHSDLLANCDLVLGKLGYGLVSECLHWGRPIAYPSRFRFCEHAALAEAVQNHRLGFALNIEDLQSCNLQHVLSWCEQSQNTCYRQSAIDDILGLIVKLNENGRLLSAAKP